MRTADILVQAIMLDQWPRISALVDFGLDNLPMAEGQKRYEAYYYPIRAGEITADQLHSAVGNGEALTKILQKCKSQRHKDVVIKTVYDGTEDDLP